MRCESIAAANVEKYTFKCTGFLYVIFAAAVIPYSGLVWGIEGGKKGPADAWDNAVNILRAANSKEELEEGFVALDKALATPANIDKVP